MYPLSYVAITDPLMVWDAITALWEEITGWVLARDACRYLLRGVSLGADTNGIPVSNSMRWDTRTSKDIRTWGLRAAGAEIGIFRHTVWQRTA